MILKSPETLHPEKRFYGTLGTVHATFANKVFFISLKIAETFQVDKVISPPCIWQVRAVIS